MHITYENDEVEVEVVDEAVQEMLNNKADTRKTIEKAIVDLEARMKDYEKEQKAITGTVCQSFD